MFTRPPQPCPDEVWSKEGTITNFKVFGHQRRGLSSHLGDEEQEQTSLYANRDVVTEAKQD